MHSEPRHALDSVTAFSSLEGAPERLEARAGAAAGHEQLPGVHRHDLPRAVRGGLRARHQRGPRRDQVTGRTALGL